MKLNMDLVRLAVAEFSASAIFICMGCTGIYDSIKFPSSNLHKSLNWGFAALMATQCFYCISGAYINPCCTIAALILQIIDIPTGIVYVVSQLLGTVFGYSLAYISSPEKSEHFCCTYPGFFVKEYQACMFEFFLTATWIYTFCAAWEPRNADHLETLPLRFGFMVVATNIAGAYFTGASMNPFRSLAAAVFNNHYESLWIYLLIPPITAIIISTAWRFLYVAGSKPTSSDE